MKSIALALAVFAAAQTPAQTPPSFFTTPLSLDHMKGKQAVIETTMGTIVMDLLAEAAPNHVGYFIKLATDGGYNGTTFHRVIARGIIQGGDPLSKDPANQARYGTGGLGVLKAEVNAEKHTRGAVSAVLVPGRPDSAGSQFFICVVDQPALDGKYTLFGRISEGINVVTKISAINADPQGRALERVEIKSITIRDTPPPAPEPFSTESVDELRAYQAVLETSLGPVTIAFFPEKAPEHVRNFLRLASAGVYDGMAFHRVARGFVIQTGHVPTRREPLDERQQKLVRNLQPEFNDTRHVKGIVSMARGDDPASASTSFFIVTATGTALDGKYTAFGRVVQGIETVEAIEKMPVDGETPKERVELARVRVESTSPALARRGAGCPTGSSGR